MQYLVELRKTKQGFVASFILGTLETPAKDCKRALWTKPRKTEHAALDELSRKLEAIA